jgi:uncharacterized protein YaiL (DUF2058 family)
MGSLRDQFKKANLLSSKDAKRLAHEERIERKEKGRDVLEAERAAREAELAQARADERARDRSRQAEVEAQRKLAEERAACEALLDTEVRDCGRGPISWHFELPDGRLPLLRMTDPDRHQLTAGHLCIVRRRGPEAHVYGLLATQHARRVVRQFPERVVWSAPGALGKDAG